MKIYKENDILQNNDDPSFKCVVIKVTPKLVSILYLSGRSWKIKERAKDWMDVRFSKIGETDSISFSKLKTDLELARPKIEKNINKIKDLLRI